MRKLSIPKDWYKPVIILLIISHFFSCVSWKKINQPIEEYFETKQKHILVEKADKSKIELYDVYVEDDSLKGNSNRWIGNGQPLEKIFTSIPLSEIQSVQEYLETKPKKILVKKTDRSIIELYNFYIENDSLKGDAYLGRGYNQQFEMTVTSIPLNEIQSIHFKGLNYPLIILTLCLGFAIALGITAYMMSGFDMEWDTSGMN